MFGDAMRFDKKAVILFLLTTLLTVYTITIHVIAEGHLYEDPVSSLVYWTSGPSGSLFPWPRVPGMLEIITQVNAVDRLIYQSFIKTWALAGLSLVMWVITGLSVFRRINSTEQPATMTTKEGGTTVNPRGTN
jgi:hypothetical protein